MNSKLIWANFSVKDARRTDEFYRQLGFIPNGSLNDPKLASFFFGKNKLVIHFFEQGTGIDKFFPTGSKTDEIIFTLSAETKDEVKEFEAKVRKAGGEIFEKLERDEAGYYGFAFADPDGHKFNVLLMDNM